jgi:hypothetical protein
MESCWRWPAPSHHVMPPATQDHRFQRWNCWNVFGYYGLVSGRFTAFPCLFARPACIASIPLVLRVHNNTLRCIADMRLRQMGWTRGFSSGFPLAVIPCRRSPLVQPFETFMQSQVVTSAADMVPRTSLETHRPSVVDFLRIVFPFANVPDTLAPETGEASQLSAHHVTSSNVGEVAAVPPRLPAATASTGNLASLPTTQSATAPIDRPQTIRPSLSLCFVCLPVCGWMPMGRYVVSQGLRKLRLVP